MILGVEGNVNVGKTTFIREYAKQNSLEVLNETPFLVDASPFSRQLYYISSEIQKKNNLSSKSAIMDRTILSVYLYTIISKEFTKTERNFIINNIQKLICENKILIPDKLIFMLYPFELINKKHAILGNKKNTQSLLVDYDYYLKYTLFFATALKNNKELILNTQGNRQVLLFNDSKIYRNLSKSNIKLNSVIILDGAPAIGKTTIGNLQSKYCYIQEQHYKKYSLSDMSNQIESIIKRINLLRENNILIDTSFLMGITHLFYSHDRELTKDEKLNIIYEIMQNIPLFLYVTKIIYLYTDISILKNRKNCDETKTRKHFGDNIKYLSKEINFYKKLDKLMQNMSNIYLIEASKSPNIIIEEIDSRKEKTLLLVDLFFYIIKCIERGEI